MSPVFISYASADRKQALGICEALEQRGAACWISCRDVQPGANYQDAIVDAIKTASAVVLVFSARANVSEEIKKELSLASRFHVPVIAARIEDVEPTGGFAYELSTRQWIDLFDHRERALDTLAMRIQALSVPVGETLLPPLPHARPRRRGALIAGIAALILLLAVLSAWHFLRPVAPKTQHTMEVRLTGFRALSPDLPVTLPDAIHDEIIAAFSADGVVGVSTASAPPPGTAPAYTLGGTVRRDGDKVRVIAQLSNERSGVTLWSNTFTYDAASLAKVPRRIAVDAGNLMRCGLFGASTYSKALPDPVLTAYLQYCHNDSIDFQPTKALDSARKVVAAAPDFSWGWSAVEFSLIYLIDQRPPAEWPSLREEAIRAADRAVALDPANSEALAGKSMLIEPGDLVAREALVKQALKARALACACEYHVYGDLLGEVGRNADARDQYARSVDVLALNAVSQLSLGIALLQSGDADRAKPHIDAWADLTGDPKMTGVATIEAATATHDYAGAVRVLRDPPSLLPLPLPLRTAWIAAFEALASGDARVEAAAVPALVALPDNASSGAVTVDLIGALGANAEALGAVRANNQVQGVRAWLFSPGMAGARADPAFPALADKLGLTRYWKTTGIKPDFCKAADAPAYCKTL